ncbi:hypothetical protein H2200_010309 [Cladophialophora chaetospira]|uniref:Uncharacterized protein n=1 Tax=Cladophialophora chaetospira TaxID=386627 RepID=A0AA38X180_9EURO|nr:hypothetical protein H2200_010309 [Cladophialophora chaetospira]
MDPLRGREAPPTTTFKNPPSVTVSEKEKVTTKSRGQSERTKGESRTARWLSDSWILNYGALLVSTASLTLAVLILRAYNGRPLSDWHYPLSFNTALSVLGTIMKGSAMLATATALSQSRWVWFHKSQRPLQDFALFNDASRGPLGAFQLLWRLRMWHIASLGAVVTLLALVSDVALQASATFPVHSTASGDASIPISTSYNFSAIPAAAESIDDMDPSLKVAVFSSTVAGKSRSQFSAVTPRCSTGNCKFPPYATLAICSSCQNITTSIQTTLKLYPPPTWNLNRTVKVFNITLPAATGTRLYEDIPVYENISIQLSDDGYPGFMTMNSAQPYWTYGLTTLTQYFGTNHEDPSLSTTYVLMTQGLEAEAPNAPINRAFNCGLRLCMKTYKGSIVNGRLVETELRGMRQTGWTVSAGEDGGLGKLGRSVTLSEGHEVHLDIEESTIRSLATYLPSVLSGDGDPFLDEDNPTSANNLDIIQGIYSNDPEDVTEAWERMASALTVGMRVGSGNTVIGTALAQVAFIHVRWEFMVPPLTMVLLAVVFVALVRLQSRTCRIPVWGANGLADIVYAGGDSLDITSTVIVVEGTQLTSTTRPEAMVKVSELQRWADGKVARLRVSHTIDKDRRIEKCFQVASSQSQPGELS